MRLAALALTALMLAASVAYARPVQCTFFAGSWYCQ